MPDCDPEVFRNGEIVAVCAHGKNVAEDFAVEMRSKGLRVDWYFAAKRKVPVLATLDDPDDILKKWKQFISVRESKGEL